MTTKPQNQSEDVPSEFEQLQQEKSLPLVIEFAVFLRENKKWWLIPILLVLGLMGIVVVLGPTGVGPFIYTLF